MRRIIPITILLFSSISCIEDDNFHSDSYKNYFYQNKENSNPKDSIKIKVLIDDDKDKHDDITGNNKKEKRKSELSIHNN